MNGDQGVEKSGFSWRFLTPLYVGSALNPVNSSLIATALVPIATDLRVSVGNTAILIAALYLASTIAQPTAGKLAEVVGPRKVFLAGIALVSIGGALGGLANDLHILTVSRVLIGAGTSCAYPTAVLLIRRRADDVGMDEAPGGVLGGLQIAGVATASLGLPLGGLLVQLIGWRSIFWINLPVALVAAFVTVVWIPSDGPVARTSARNLAAQLDVIGVLLFAGAMTAGLAFLFSLPTPTWWLLGLSVVLWSVDFAWERRSSSPFIDLTLLSNRPAVVRTYLRFGLVLLCSYLVLYGVTQWVQSSKGLSAVPTGLLLLPMTAVSAIVVPPIARRNLVRAPLIIAAVCCVVGGAMVLLLPTSAWIAWAIAIAVAMGIATGCASSNTIALYRQADEAQLGTASGLMRASGYVGSIGSSAVTAVVFKDRVADSGLLVIAVVILVVGAALLVFTARDRSLRPEPQLQASTH